MSAPSRHNHTTPLQNVEHLKNPTQLQKVPVAGRRLAKKTETTAAPAPVHEFPVGTVHVVLPFRGSHLNLLPSLIKNLARIKKFSGDAFRLIIAPVSWESDVGITDVKERVQAIVSAAGQHLSTQYPITIAEPVPVEEQVCGSVTVRLPGRVTGCGLLVCSWVCLYRAVGRVCTEQLGVSVPSVLAPVATTFLPSAWCFFPSFAVLPLEHSWGPARPA